MGFPKSEVLEFSALCHFEQLRIFKTRNSWFLFNRSLSLFSSSPIFLQVAKTNQVTPQHHAWKCLQLNSQVHCLQVLLSFNCSVIPLSFLALCNKSPRAPFPPVRSIFLSSVPSPAFSIHTPVETVCRKCECSLNWEVFSPSCSPIPWSLAVTSAPSLSMSNEGN